MIVEGDWLEVRLGVVGGRSAQHLRPAINSRRITCFHAPAAKSTVAVHTAPSAPDDSERRGSLPRRSCCSERRCWYRGDPRWSRRAVRCSISQVGREPAGLPQDISGPIFARVLYRWRLRTWDVNGCSDHSSERRRSRPTEDLIGHAQDSASSGTTTCRRLHCPCTVQVHDWANVR
jgi:hypothetical protein